MKSKVLFSLFYPFIIVILLTITTTVISCANVNRDKKKAEKQLQFPNLRNENRQ